MLKAVGRNVPRKEGRDKVSGTSRYIDDLSFPGLLHARTIRSTIPAGAIADISFPFDTSGFTIVGFNDMEFMAAAVPTLSSVRTNRYEMGRRAATMIMDAIEGRPVTQREVDLGFEVIERQSSTLQRTAASLEVAAGVASGTKW